jgi:anaerobic magnesium-protoporphyrin IX monomethyl ester cyclase
MNISFIVPCTGHSFRDPHIAVTALATFINAKSNHKTTIIDYAYHMKSWKKHIISQLETKKPDIIGITCTEAYLPVVKDIINLVKKYDASLPILLGGYFPTLVPKKAILINGVDYVCVGDGEESIIELLDYLKTDYINIGSKNQSDCVVKGIWQKKYDDRIVKNESRPFYEKLEDYPFLDWDLWDDIKKYVKVNGYIPISMNRGCYGDCSFCCAHSIKKIISGHYIRCVSPKRYVDEIKYQLEKI